jgi:SAM-dependent methyltransferase
MGPDGWPMPPPREIFAVSAAPSSQRYLETGARDAKRLAAILDRAGIALNGSETILDFGCGCARLARHLAGWTRGDLLGRDRSASAIRWCREHLPFGQFETNALRPPLALGDATVDLCVAWSVFTHLDESLAEAWLAELHRVLTPGGHALLTTQGRAYRSRLPRPGRARFDSGEVVVLHRRGVGTNLCAAFHPISAMRARLGRYFSVLDHDEAELGAAFEHDVWLVRREPLL